MKPTKIQILFLSIGLPIIITMMAFAHPFYLSVTDLSYSSKDQSLKGTIKVFANDLETSLSKLYGKPIDLMHGKDKAALNKLLDAYLAERFEIQIAGKTIPYEFLGFEKESELFWLYLETKSCPFPKQLVVKNTVLYEFSNAQSNIIQIEVNGVKQSGKLTFPDKTMPFEF